MSEAAHLFIEEVGGHDTSVLELHIRVTAQEELNRAFRDAMLTALAKEGVRFIEEKMGVKNVRS